MRQTRFFHKLFLCFVLVALIEVVAADVKKKARRLIKKTSKRSKRDPGPVSPSSLDPTKFKSARKGYKSLIESKPYANFVKPENRWVCLYHSVELLMPACGNLQASIEDPDLCCGSIQAMMDKDKGNCLCEPRVQASPDVLAGLFGQAQQLNCDINFPIPDAQGAELILALRESGECVGIGEDAGTLENAQFLDLTPEEVRSTPLEELPTFKDIFVPPPGGPYKDISYVNVNVTRPAPSVIVNQYSTAETFSALVVYPSNRAEETIDPATGESQDPVLADGSDKFPIVSFSPGFITSPDEFLLMMSHLASFGMIVISQRSTQELLTSSSEEASPAWARDIAYGLLHLSEEGSKEKSFLHKRIDENRAAVAGHSFGAVHTFLAASTAVDLGINVQVIAALQPSCIVFDGVCDTAAKADLGKLNNPNYLILAGKEDPIAPPSHSRYMATVATMESKGSFTLNLKEIDGLNHCLREGDPSTWPFSISCGRGEISQFEQVKEAQIITGEFLTDAFGIV